MTERYNHPGTSGDWNWTAALPTMLEDLGAHPRVKEIAAILRPDRLS